MTATADMRVLMVTFAYPPFLEMGGPPRKVASLAQQLARNGHGVEVLTVNHLLGRPAVQEERDGVPVHYLRTTARYRGSFTVNPRLFRAARERVASSDIVHIFGVYDLLGPAVARAARRARVPYVLEPLGMYRPILRSLRKKRLYRRVLGRRVAEGAAKVVATSELERRELVAEGVPSSKVVERPNGVDLEEYRSLPDRGAFREGLDIPDGASLVLFLSRLTPKKRPEFVVDALPRVADPTTRVAFVGPDEDGMRASLVRRSRARGVVDRIAFAGPLYGRDKAQAFVDADVLVLPSESENFANVALEAVACGLPVVLSDRCGIAPEIEGKVGLAISPDPVALAEAIDRVLMDPELRERTGRDGPAIAARYSWEQIARQNVAIYEAVLSSSPRDG